MCGPCGKKNSNTVSVASKKQVVRRSGEPKKWVLISKGGTRQEFDTAQEAFAARMQGGQVQVP